MWPPFKEGIIFTTQYKSQTQLLQVKSNPRHDFVHRKRFLFVLYPKYKEFVYDFISWTILKWTLKARYTLNHDLFHTIPPLAIVHFCGFIIISGSLRATITTMRSEHKYILSCRYNGTWFTTISGSLTTMTAIHHIFPPLCFIIQHLTEST